MGVELVNKLPSSRLHCSLPSRHSLNTTVMSVICSSACMRQRTQVRSICELCRACQLRTHLTGQGCRRGQASSGAGVQPLQEISCPHFK